MCYLVFAILIFIAFPLISYGSVKFFDWREFGLFEKDRWDSNKITYVGGDSSVAWLIGSFAWGIVLILSSVVLIVTEGAKLLKR
jgi:hypothetical protein